MTTKHEQFGNVFYEDEPDIVGECSACGGQIYDYELANCEHCGEQIHEGCKVSCESCGESGCKACKIYDPDSLGYYCDSLSTGKLEDSECFERI